MQLLKEKVADKLSHILASSPSHFSDGSSIDSEARPLSKEESYGSQKSISSYLLSFLPTASFDRHRSIKRRHDVRPVRSLPARWRSKTFSWRDKPPDNTAEHAPSPFEGKETLEETGKEDERGSDVLGRNICYPENYEGVSTSNLSVKLVVPNHMEDSSFISSDLYEFLGSCLPNIVKGCQWALLYSTLKHGISLHTLLRKSIDLPGPCLLITGDRQGAVFGGLLECPLNPTAKRKYQGTHQTFVFTTIYGQPRLFRATGANRYYYLCLNDLLAFGGGGNFALCLDEDLLHGTSGPCETFGNLCLAHSEEFELKNVELWGFTHSSRYLS